MWVRNIDGTYVIENVNEEAIAHAPRRRWLSHCKAISLAMFLMEI
jgi:hypothetical protein